MDPTDPQVKEWLPQFERLQKFLPQIKALDAQIAKSPNDPAVAGPLLQRARVFVLADRPLLAIEDAERAFNSPKHCWMQGKLRMQQSWRSTGIFVVEKTSTLATRRYVNLEAWILVCQQIPGTLMRWSGARKF
jgi:hypothetical protein